MESQGAALGELKGWFCSFKWNLRFSSRAVLYVVYLFIYFLVWKSEPRLCGCTCPGCLMWMLEWHIVVWQSATLNKADCCFQAEISHLDSNPVSDKITFVYNLTATSNRFCWEHTVIAGWVKAHGGTNVFLFIISSGVAVGDGWGGGGSTKSGTVPPETGVGIRSPVCGEVSRQKRGHFLY